MAASIYQALAQLAQERPESKAVVAQINKHSIKSYTYRKLFYDVTIAAQILKRTGISKGAKVLLAQRPSYELFVAIYALIAIGATPVFY